MDTDLFTSAKDWIKQKANDALHTTAVAGEGALHAAADTAGFVGDVAVDAAKLAKNVGKKIVRSSEPPETLDIPGFGPVSAMTQQSYEKAQQEYTKGNVPKPRNRFEQGVNIAARGAADVLAGGGEAAGPRALASGAAAGLAGSAVNDLTDSPAASAAAALVTAIVTHAAPDVVSGVRTGRMINAGLQHPDYAPLVNEVVAREGGGTFDHPNVNPKSGAMGVMQVTPETARDPGYGIRPWDGKSQADLARVGRQKFAVLLGKYNDPERALAAYNWGEGNVDKAVKKYGNDWYYHAPKETQDYVAKSMMNVYGGPRSVSSEGRGVPPIDINEAMGMDPNIVNNGDYDPYGDSYGADDRAPQFRDNGQDMSREGPIVPEQPSWEDINKEFPGWADDLEQKPFTPNEDGVEITYDEPHSAALDYDQVMEKALRGKENLTPDEQAFMNDVGYAQDPIAGEWMPREKAYDEGFARHDEKNYTDLYDIEGPVEPSRLPAYQQYERTTGRKIGALTQQAIADVARANNLNHPYVAELYVDSLLNGDYGHPVVQEIKDLRDTLAGAKMSPEEFAAYNKLPNNDPQAHAQLRRFSDTFRKSADSVERDTNPPAASSSFGTARPNMRNRAAPTKAPEGHEPPKGEWDNLPPEEKLIRALNEATPLSREQRRAIHEERVARAAKIESIQRTEGGLKGFKASMKELKGQMPKVDYQSIADRFTPADVDHLLNKVATNNWLLPYEKITAQNALMRLLGAEGGKVPSPAELKLLAHIFPEPMIDALMKNRPFAEKFWNGVANGLNIPRSLMASFDLSAPLRQGVFMVGRKEFYPAFIKMFKLFGSEKASRAMMDEIRSRDTYPLMRRAGLAITDPEGRFMDAREEAFMSSWAEKIPVIGKGVRASDRAYSGFLNKLRADSFDSLVKLSREAGVDLEHDGKALKDIAHYINSATGRGDVGEVVAKNAHILNAMFFSPRLMASRVTMLNPAFYVRLSPVVRREAIKSLIGFSAIALTVLSLAKMGGASVELDPRSADFAKIRVGDTRFDILGGFQQYIRFGAEMLTGEAKTAKGQIRSLTSGKFGQDTRLDVVEKFFENKFSPVASFIADFLRGKDPVGNKFNLKNETVQRFIPLVAQDTADAVREYGEKGLLYGVPGIFGVGVQTYKPKPSKPKHHGPKSVFDTTPTKPRKPRASSVFVEN